MTPRLARLAPALALSLLALTACIPVTEPMPDPPATCGADGLQGLIGQSEAVLATMRFAQPIRIIRPGMAVTMDYNPNRLNIEVDGFGQIIRVSCG
jgi:hypothetical protein